MIHSALLLTRGQRLFLIRSNQPFDLLVSLLVNLSYLLLFLLWRERRVRAHRFYLRMRLALDRPPLIFTWLRESPSEVIAESVKIGKQCEPVHAATI